MVEALRKGDDARATALLEEVMGRLKEYLQVVYSADEISADECVQQSIYEALDQIRRDNIRNEKTIFSYLLISVRNEYLSYAKYQHRFLGDDEHIPPVEAADQLDNLLEEERQRILKECLKELDKKALRLITHLMENPNESYKRTAQRLKIKEGTIRTRRSRIIDILHHCYKWKSTR